MPSVYRREVVMMRKLANRYVDACCLGAMVLAAFLLRYVCMPTYQVIAADGPSYIAIAREILEHHTAKGSIHYPPFYPLLIAIVSLVTKDFESAGMIISLVMGSLLLVPVFLLGRSLFGRDVGYIAAAIALVWPEFVSLSGVVLAHSTYFTLLTAGLYLLWVSMTKERVLVAVVGGATLAVAYLSRQEAFISLFAVCLFTSALIWYRERTVKRILPMVVAFLTFFALIFPYVLLVHEIMGFWTLAGKSVVTLTDCLSAYLQRPDLNRDPSFSKIGYLELLSRYPGYFPYNIKKNLVELFSAIPTPLIIFSVLGFVAGRREENYPYWRAFVAGTLSPIIALIVLFFVSGAYVAPYMPILFVLCGRGMLVSERWLSEKLLCSGSKKAGVQMVSLFLVLGYVGITAYREMPHSSSPPYTPEMDGGRYDQKLMGKMLQKELSAGSKIMTRSGRIAFYSGFPWVDIPQTDLAAILKTARENRVRYLIVDGQLVMLRPQLGELLSPLGFVRDGGIVRYNGTQEVLPGLFLKLLFTDNTSLGVVVYEFKY